MQKARSIQFFPKGGNYLTVFLLLKKKKLVCGNLMQLKTSEHTLQNEINQLLSCVIY